MTTQEEYSIFLDQVNNLTERRQKVTSTHLSVNAALVGITSFVFKDVQMVDWGRNLSVLMLLIAGLVVCSLWRKLIGQYSALLKWWYEQLRNIEEKMPDSNKLLTQEYHKLYLNKEKKMPIGLTRYETYLTWVFSAIYAIFGLVIIISLVFF